MPIPKPANPFYAALLVVGVVFALTACLYCVMCYRQLDPRAPVDQGVIQFLAKHGMAVMLAELALLAILTFSAIGTDDFWIRRAASLAPEPAEKKT